MSLKISRIKKGWLGLFLYDLQWDKTSSKNYKVFSDLSALFTPKWRHLLRKFLPVSHVGLPTTISGSQKHVRGTQHWFLPAGAGGWREWTFRWDVKTLDQPLFDPTTLQSWSASGTGATFDSLVGWTVVKLHRKIPSREWSPRWDMYPFHWRGFLYFHRET